MYYTTAFLLPALFVNQCHGLQWFFINKYPMILYYFYILGLAMSFFQFMLFFQFA